MTCERCGHEHTRLHLTRYDECIANLRADLTAAHDERDQAVNDLMANHELAWRGIRADLEAERTRSWELARDLDLSKSAFRRLREAYDAR